MLAFDYIFDQSNQPVLLEISYGFGNDSFWHDGCWDIDMKYYEGKFDACGWMVDLVLLKTHRL